MGSTQPENNGRQINRAVGLMARLKNSAASTVIVVGGERTVRRGGAILVSHQSSHSQLSCAQGHGALPARIDHPHHQSA